MSPQQHSRIIEEKCSVLHVQTQKPEAKVISIQLSCYLIKPRKQQISSILLSQIKSQFCKQMLSKQYYWTQLGISSKEMFKYHLEWLKKFPKTNFFLNFRIIYVNDTRHELNFNLNCYTVSTNSYSKYYTFSYYFHIYYLLTIFTK